MNTFLPYPSFARSAAVLDDRRLGKQRVEAMQLVQAITRLRVDDGVVVRWTPRGWLNHPATLMWRETPGPLVGYGIACCDEWLRRGFRDTVRGKLALLAAGLPPGPAPWWLGDEAFHRAHRSVLIRKDPAHYRPLFPDTPDDLEPVWPGVMAPPA